MRALRSGCRWPCFVKSADRTTRRRAVERLLLSAVLPLAGACAAERPPASTTPLPALTADSFRGSGLRGVGIGVLSGARRSDADLDAVAELGADHVRVFLEGRRCDRCSGYELATDDLARLDELLPRLAQRKLHTVLVVGIGADARGPLFTHEARQASFIDMWARLARRLRGRTEIAGFDILNEPVPDGFTFAQRQSTWLRFAQRVGEAVRAEDPGRVLIVESAPDATPQSFENLKPLALANVVYSVHSYHPIDFTHQTVMKEYPKSKVYDENAGNDSLAAGLAAAVAFGERHRVPIYVGEFSAVRWAPQRGAARYIAESIRRFESHGWSWSYHEFRGWHGWDSEQDERGGGRSFDAPVARLLRQAMADTPSARTR